MAAYAACHDGFLRYCSALAFERMDVEDLVQDVLLSAFKKFEDLEEPEKLQHYLIRAARNRAVSRAGCRSFDRKSSTPASNASARTTSSSLLVIMMMWT